jgi:hypothetical protein
MTPVHLNHIPPKCHSENCTFYPSDVKRLTWTRDQIINKIFQIQNKESIKKCNLYETQNGETHEIKLFS